MISEVRFPDVSDVFDLHSDCSKVDSRLGLLSSLSGIHHVSFVKTRLAYITIFFTTITNRPAMTPTMALSTHGGTPLSGVLGGTGVVRVGIC